MNDAAPPASVAILAFADASASVVWGMYDLFMSAGRDWGFIVTGEPGRALFEPRVLAAQDGRLLVFNGVPIEPHGTYADCAEPDIVCVPDINVPPGQPLDDRAEDIAALRRWYAGGATIASACSGAMLLAQAGLLDGEEATTHWAYCDVMRERHPAVKVRPQRHLVVAGEGGRLVMAGSGVSWLDVALYLIARSAGVEAAMQVARVMLIDWHDIGQQPFARLVRSRQVDDAVIGRCQGWIAEHYHEAAPVAAMVRLSGLAERSFKRRFHQATGMSPLEYVHTLRLEEAKQLLESGNAPIEAIANEVGYEDAGFFSRLFRRNVNLTPAQYRKRFGALRSRLGAADARA